jgi:hypothetical protein
VPRTTGCELSQLLVTSFPQTALPYPTAGGIGGPQKRSRHGCEDKKKYHCLYLPGINPSGDQTVEEHCNELAIAIPDLRSVDEYCNITGISEHALVAVTIAGFRLSKSMQLHGASLFGGTTKADFVSSLFLCIFLHCATCIISSGLGAGKAYKLIFALGTEMSETGHSGNRANRAAQ